MGWVMAQILAVTFQWAMQASIQSEICNLRQEAQRFLVWSEQNKTIVFNTHSLVSLNVYNTNTNSNV